MPTSRSTSSSASSSPATSCSTARRERPPSRTLLIATGYLRLGPQDNSSALFNEQGRSRAEWMTDLVETTGTAFLGLTFTCCRCHDHKYDPLSQADHYRFRAFFEAVKYGDDLALDLADDQAAINAHNAEIDKLVQPHQARRDELLAAAKQRIRERKINELTEEEQTTFDLARDDQPDDVKAKIDDLKKRIEPSDDECPQGIHRGREEGRRSRERPNQGNE